MAKNQIAKREVDLENISVKFMFSHGDALIVKSTDFPEEIQKALIANGMSQVIGDSYSAAGGDSKKAMELALAKIERMKQGQWQAPRGEGGSSRVTITTEAFQRLLAQAGKDVEPEQALELWNALTDEQRDTIKASDKFKLAKAEISAERQKAKVKDANEGLDDVLTQLI